MDDPIHVQVEIIKLGNLVLLDHLGKARIPFRHIPIKFRNTHFSKQFETKKRLRIKNIFFPNVFDSEDF